MICKKNRIGPVGTTSQDSVKHYSTHQTPSILATHIILFFSPSIPCDHTYMHTNMIVLFFAN
jgi:hypothetical protein